MNGNNVHPSNPRYYPWKIYDAPDSRLLGRVFRGADLKNLPPTFFPNGTVFQHRKKGNLRMFWNGDLVPIQTLDAPISARGR